MDVDFMLTDTFELIRPGMTLFKTFDDAGRAVDELMATQALHPAGEVPLPYVMRSSLL